jgi:tetratricopeptide (TPR) repeat protein
MDFGIAEILLSTSQQRKTIQGSFDYMPPEQWQGMICRESDQYALGCLAYRLYTGHVPFHGQSYHDLQHMHFYEAPLQPRWYNPAMPEYVEEAILTAMAKACGQRHESVLAFLRALRIVASPTEKRAPFPKSKAQWFSEGYAFYKAQQYHDALAAFNQVLQLDAEHAPAYYWKGLTLSHLNHLESALAAFDAAIRYDPRYPMAYNERGNVLYRLGRYGEAVAAYTMAIHLNPYYVRAYQNKSAALNALHMPREALLMRQKARQLEGGQHKETNGTDAIKPHQPQHSFRV